MTTDGFIPPGGEQELPPLAIPDSFNYIAVFLTFACNLTCSYCINRYGEFAPSKRTMTCKEWLRGLNRIISRPDLPITLQGGEPTLHPAIWEIIAGIRPDLHIDLLTNLEFDINRFISLVPPERMRREAPYASIRVSYHPEVMKIEPLAAKVLALLDRGYSIGIWGVEHPRHHDQIATARDYCTPFGIDFRTKEFLGEHEGRLYGEYRYPGACGRQSQGSVLCRTTELIVGPGGDIYRCHGDLYEGRKPLGHLLDPGFIIDTDFRPCHHFGLCNPCDIKIKTNRFQQFGHTSVEIIPK